MTKVEIERLLDCIGQEGFNYCFNNYSSFKDVNDDEFHELRNKMLEAQKKFKIYIKDTAQDIINMDENYLLDILEI